MNYLSLKRILFAFIFITLMAGCSSTKQLAIEISSQKEITYFFERMSNRSSLTALDSLLLTNKYFNFSDSVTIKLRNQFEDLNLTAGRFIGESLLNKRIISNDLAAYSYLAKFESKFYRFLFIFYNSGEQTKIYKFSFDDNIDLEIEESIKLYYK